jgi:tetratricopeptide (TPR) repeat protein
MIQEKADIERIYNHIKVLEARYRKNIDSHLFFPLADAYIKADMLDQAEVILREGLSNHPKYCAAKALLGEVFYKKGNLRDAQNQLEEVVEIVPDNIKAHKLLIEVYKRNGLQDRYERELMTLKMIDQEERTYSGRGHIETRLAEDFVERNKPNTYNKEEIETIKAEDSDEVSEEKKLNDFKGEDKEEIVTATLAELYFSQGFIEKSIEIYNKLLIQQPDREKWAQRLRQIQVIYKNMKVESEPPPDRIMRSETEIKKEKILLTLERWLENCQRLKDNRK